MIDLHFGIMFSVGDNQKRKHQVHEKKKRCHHETLINCPGNVQKCNFNILNCHTSEKVRLKTQCYHYLCHSGA